MMRSVRLMRSLVGMGFGFSQLVLLSACTVTLEGNGGDDSSDGNDSNKGADNNTDQGGNGGAAPGLNGGGPAHGGAGGEGNSTSSGDAEVGDACEDDAACDPLDDATCLTEADYNWPAGYCTIFECETADECGDNGDCFDLGDKNGCLALCEDKGDCRDGYVCHPSAQACVPGCQNDEDCGAGEGCSEDGECVQTSDSDCPAPLVYNATIKNCEIDTATDNPGTTIPVCDSLPERDCTGTVSYCGELLPFEPDDGTGYEDYNLNGETEGNQYRSYARRDLQMLVKYASAYVDCYAANWNFGNGKVLGLGDMSEATGDIPGTSVNQPGHPAGTHVDGFDMDIAYFQDETQPNNYLRAVCDHEVGGNDAYHCVDTPDTLDYWRSALFLGALLSSSTVRVIGVDGRVGPLVEQAMDWLCANNWLDDTSCKAAKWQMYTSQNKWGGLAYETTDEGQGWYSFHHHHLHVSLNGTVPAGSPLWSGGSAIPFAPMTREKAMKMIGPGCGM